MSMKKKLSILIYSLSNGGAERVVSILLNQFKEKYDISLYLMNDTIFYEIPKDVKIVYLEKSNPNESPIKKFIKLILLAIKYKKINNSEISLSFMNRPNYINILAKIFGMKSKVIISERAMPSLQHSNGLQGKVNRFLIKNLYKYSDVITANSLGNSKDLIENFCCKKVVTINNIFDKITINQLSNEKISFRDNNFTFITVGRLDNGKNHSIMIDAIKSIDAKLYIIGDGELRSTLQNKIIEDSLEDKVIFLDRQINPYKYISQADCFLFSSSHEGYPNVLVEALICGLPIISTDCKSGPREILAPNSNIDFQLEDKIELCEYGILVPINNKEKLKESMNMIINDEELRNRYKEKSKIRADFFRIDKIIKQYEEIICVE
ncbi:glycosyltransferase [Aliarcobacter cryaerophilus]|uniref:glycosyltransferase n=1 Tax=Aliarcobacter cryaerophilus TaxID=28198 RepID=UPI0021B517A6|nr:glycosyltransferase [Aliarcobacter cryaerophilus]MCT7531793.1 glycosyltransferase [Aliarcobacter cryaerophilus]